MQEHTDGIEMIVAMIVGDVDGLKKYLTNEQMYLSEVYVGYAHPHILRYANSDDSVSFSADCEQQILLHRRGQMGLHFARLVLPQQRHLHTERIRANIRRC